ncbi:MAG: CapA family protein, partial [Chloroflexota bacterium]
ADAQAAIEEGGVAPAGAVVLRAEPYIPIGHVGARPRDLTREELRAWARGQGTALTPVVADDGAALRDLLGVAELPAAAVVMPDWAACAEHVATHAGTWALVPWDAVSQRVQPMRVEGHVPEARALTDYPLQRRIWLLARAPLPPDLVAALQGALCYAPPPSVELVAVGDVMLGRSVGDAMRATSPRYPFEGVGVQALLSGADLAFGNLECAISDRGQRQVKAYTFRAAPSAALRLTFAGLDVLALANNHSMDYGPLALADTVAHLREAGLVPVGAGANTSEAYAPQIVERNGLRLAFLAYNEVGPRWMDAAEARPGSAYLDPARLAADVRAARAQADLVIVSCHWGIESRFEATAGQQRVARSLEEAGAALVIGHHPHVVQGLAHGRTALAVYSLGNFVFDMGLPNTSEGVALRCTLDPTGVKTFALLPYAIRRGQPALLGSTEGAPILARIARLTALQGGLPQPQAASPAR